MSLDKWIKNDDDNKKAKKKPPKNEKVNTTTENLIQNSSITPNNTKNSRSLTKFALTCSNSKCKYNKTIKKKTLKEKDKICPRCNKEMKIKILNN